MPFVSDPNLEDPNNPNSGTSSQPQAGQVSGQPSVVSGSTGTQTGLQNSNSATESPQAPTLAGGQSAPSSGSAKGGGFDAKAPTASGQWTNLQSYLDANNGGQFGNQFAGNIEKNVNQAQGDLTNASTSFQNNVQSNTNQLDPNIVNELSTSPATMSSQDQASFEKARSGDYLGPQNSASDTGFQKASSEAQNAFDESQAAKTPGGQFSLLQKYFNNPTYSRGEQSLDSALLSNDPNAQAAIQRIATEGANLPVNVQSAKQAADSEASSAQAINAKAAQDALSALYGSGGSATNITGGAVKNQMDAIKNTVANQQTFSDSSYKNLLAALANVTSTAGPNYAPQVGAGASIPFMDQPGVVNNVNLTPEEAQILGITSPINIGMMPFRTPESQASAPGTYAPDLSGPTIGSFLSEAAAPTAETAATPDEIAQLNALAQLGGVNQNWLNTSQEGYSANPNFNLTGFEAAASQAYADAMNEITNGNKVPLSKYDPMSSIFSNQIRVNPDDENPS